MSYGITGQDLVEEHGFSEELDEVMPLDYGKCRLCIAAPKADNLKPEQLAGKRVATSFPNLTRRYFEQRLNIHTVSIKEISGSVEIAPTLGTAEAVVDLVETAQHYGKRGLK